MFRTFWNAGRSFPAPDTDGKRKTRRNNKRDRRRRFVRPVNFEQLECRTLLATVTIGGGSSSVWSFSDNVTTSNGQAVGGSITAGNGLALTDADLGSQVDAFDNGAMVWVNDNQVGGSLFACQLILSPRKNPPWM